jgi:AAA15 family ATPase/GTPase
MIRKNAAGKLVLLKLLLQHRGDNNVLANFDMDLESDGTARLIHLVPLLFEVSFGRERVLIIDELDRRLHPHLSRMVVETALQCHGDSQIIFTTHDTNLLDLSLFRRDEIWFVEKDKGGSSHIYSLAEFKVRPDLQIEKGYLNGRFGAIPFVGDIRSLGWHDSTPPVEDEVAHA